MPPDPQSRHIDAARKRTAHAGALLHASDQAERRILDAAHERLDRVQADLAAWRSRVMLDPATAAKHDAALVEQGQLNQVIARAHAALGTEA